MTHAALSPLIEPEFDKFLAASIGEDRNGTGLSVLSAFSRLNVDPWQEATSLARMPRDAAAARLTELIEALPGATADAIPSRMIADMVALLPTGRTLDVRSSDGGLAMAGWRGFTSPHCIERLCRDDAHRSRDLSHSFAWARERSESAAASRRSRLNGYAAPIKTGCENHRRTNWV